MENVREAIARLFICVIIASINTLYDSFWINNTSTLEVLSFQCYLACAALCFFFSSIYHWFGCLSESCHDQLLKCDLTGIGVLVTGSYIPGVYFSKCNVDIAYAVLTLVTFDNLGFYCVPYAQKIHLILTAMILLAGLIAPWIEGKIGNTPIRTILFAFLVAVSLLPFTHWVLITPPLYRDVLYIVSTHSLIRIFFFPPPIMIVFLDRNFSIWLVGMHWVFSFISRKYLKYSSLTSKPSTFPAFLPPPFHSCHVISFYFWIVISSLIFFLRIRYGICVSRMQCIIGIIILFAIGPCWWNMDVIPIIPNLYKYELKWLWFKGCLSNSINHHPLSLNLIQSDWIMILTSTRNAKDGNSKIKERMFMKLVLKTLIKMAGFR